MNGSANTSLRVRISLRNENISLTEAHCDILSIILVSSDEEIFLKETSGQILRPQSKDQTDLQDFMQLDNRTCLYQEMNYNESRMVALSASQTSLNIFLSINGVNYIVEHSNMSSALQFIDLIEYSESLSYHGENGVCGVNINANSPVGIPETGADVASVDYVNNTITDYYVELYLVVDVSLYRKYGNGTRSYVYQVVNIANLLYRPLGIHLLLVGMEIWTNADQMVITSDSGLTLENLLRYRTTVSQKHDVIQLLSGLTFTSSVLGLAYVATLCRFPSSAGLVSDSLSLTAWRTGQVMAHELGHNFGLGHDASLCSCSPDTTCIMNAVSSANPVQTKWSDCSTAALTKNLVFVKVMRCLEDIPPVEVMNVSSTCGNGVIDANEDCDPAMDSVKCCDPQTCKFNAGAQCASGRCCDKSTCRFLVAGTMCRSAANECDLPEYCNGTTENCPENRYVISGAPCDSRKGYCYNGYCGSHDLQCRSIMGGNSISNPMCYNLLMNKTSLTGCRYTYVNISSTSVTYFVYGCLSSEYYCGRLLCSNTTGTAPFFLAYYDTYSDCKYIFYDMNFTTYRDPGLVPNGANCGTNKWCVNTTCLTLPKLPDQCYCNNSGVCNDLGNCHCNNGSSGTNCSLPKGCGGSIDSGTACVNTSATTTSISRISSTVPTSTISSTRLTTSTATAEPLSCPSDYCTYSDSCEFNKNGVFCSSDQNYCCRCLGNYLPPRCETQAMASVQVQITRDISFISAYEDKNSDEFRKFEKEMCFLIRESLKSSTDVSQMNCQCAQITNGSVVGQMIVKGTAAFRVTTTDMVKYTNIYCSNHPTVSQCNGTKASVPVNFLNSCATASDCPPGTSTCTPIDSVNYTCACKNSYYLEKNSLPKEGKVCTEKCNLNTIQCLDHGECQERRGKSVTCKCYDGYYGSLCENGTPSKVIIIAAVVSTILVIIIVVLAIVVAKRIGRHRAVQPTVTIAHKETYATKDTQSDTYSDTYDMPDDMSEDYANYKPPIY